MISLIQDMLAAVSSNQPFAAAFSKARCIRRGRQYNGSVLIDKLRSEKHPASCDDAVYTVNIRKCGCCGSTFLDIGLEFRKGPA